jgi:multiple sugar transport system permease protein
MPGGPARSRSRARAAAAGRKLRDNLTGYAFLIGAIFCFALFQWFPMIRGIVMSFQHTRRGVTTWVGFDNFVRIVQDPSFWTAWKNTFYFTVLALVSATPSRSSWRSCSTSSGTSRATCASWSTCR